MVVMLPAAAVGANLPMVPLAVSGVAAVAMPLALVLTVEVSEALGKVALAPLPGMVKVTLALGIGLLNESETNTESAVANAVLMGADWLSPV